MRIPLLAAASTAVFLSLVAAAAADSTVIAVPTGSDGIRLGKAKPIPTTVAAQPGPVRIDGCFSDGRGTDGLTVVHHALRIVNGGDRAVAAVRVKFAFYDAFGDVVATRTNITESHFDPGQTVDRINLAELSDAGPPAKIACGIDAVRYADGTLAKTGSGAALNAPR